jgi:predicted phage baseplate assembly protein
VLAPDAFRVLPDVALDDLRFQELVSEARTLIVRHSPEWTEHNVSDPGITLIELFAWLTEILTYRINRIPDRLHLALLELVGVRPAPPRQARTDLRFLLETPTGVTIPAGTEVVSPRISGGDLVAFQTDEELQVPVIELAQYASERGGEYMTTEVVGGAVRPSDDAAVPFGDPPHADRALLLGFDRPIAGLVIRIRIECSRVETSGPDSSNARVLWEVSGADGRWYETSLISDETGAFMLGGGAILLEVPAQAAVADLTGQPLFWLRGRLITPDDGSRSRRFTRGPRVSALSTEVAGALVSAHHAANVVGELIGTCDGIPGTAYRLDHHPVLPLAPGETLEVREPRSEAWVSWRDVQSFALSGPGDPHFQLDIHRGEIRFGPAIRQPDGGWRRYGAVPSAGAVLRFSRYRHGGGLSGNVAPRMLSVPVRRPTNVLAVTNPQAATGGVDTETPEGARERARLEIRSRSRGVSGEDFERLALAASGSIARAICTPLPDGAGARIRLLPRVDAPDRRLDLTELTPSEELMRTVAAALDRRRLLGTSIRLVPARLRGISAVADVRASPAADLERVRQDVEHALYIYLNPLIGGSPSGPGDGWPSGRALNPGELYGIVYAIDGVEFVNILRLYETDLASGEQAAQPIDGQLELGPDELIASGRHIVKAAHRS